MVVFELFDNAQVQAGDYKALRLHRGMYGDGEWLLYDIVKDPGETALLEGDQQERLQSMIQMFEAHAAEKGIVPVRAIALTVIKCDSNRNCAAAPGSTETSEASCRMSNFLLIADIEFCPEKAVQSVQMSISRCAFWTNGQNGQGFRTAGPGSADNARVHLFAPLLLQPCAEGSWRRDRSPSRRVPRSPSASAFRP